MNWNPEEKVFEGHLFATAFLTLLVGCAGPVVNGPVQSLPPGTKPISVVVSQGTIVGAQSMTATLKRFNSDSRISPTFMQVDEYKISKRIVNGKVAVRMDRPGSGYQDNLDRTIINDGINVTMLLPGGKVFARSPVPEAGFTINSLEPDPNKGLFQRVNIEGLKAEVHRLSFRSTQRSKASEVQYSAPNEVLTSLFPGRTLLSLDITVDSEIGAVTETNITEAMSSVEIRQITTKSLVLSQDGTPIPLGSVTEEIHTFQTPLDLSDSTLPPADPSNISIITQEELDRIVEQGGKVSHVPPPSLNPEKRDYTLTTVEIMEDIDINSAPESLFRVNL